MSNFLKANGYLALIHFVQCYAQSYPQAVWVTFEAITDKLSRPA